MVLTNPIAAPSRSTRLFRENIHLRSRQGECAYNKEKSMETPTTKTKKLILPVHCPTNDYIDFDHGIVELTQEDIDTIRKLSEVVIAAKGSISDSVYRIKMFDHAVTVMQADYDAEPEDGKVALKEPEYGRIDCCTLNVSDLDFNWSFYPKHGSDLCTTDTVSFSELDTFETLDEREVA